MGKVDLQLAPTLPGPCVSAELCRGIPPGKLAGVPRFDSCGVVEKGLRRTNGGSNTHPHAAPKVVACASSIHAPPWYRLSAEHS